MINIRESLENILGLVSEDLRFAETKNAALLTANAAAVVGILQVNPSSQGAGAVLGVFLNILTVVCTVSGLVSLISFIPRVENPYASLGVEPAASDNLLFFGHIQKYDPPAYLRAIYTAAGRGDDPHEQLERMYAEQVVVSSRIAARKFTYFRWAIWITIGGLATPPLAYLLYLGINENQRERAVAALKKRFAGREKPAAPAPESSTPPATDAAPGA